MNHRFHPKTVLFIKETTMQHCYETDDFDANINVSNVLARIMPKLNNNVDKTHSSNILERTGT